MRVELINVEAVKDLYKNHGLFACCCYATPDRYAEKVGESCQKSGHTSGSRCEYIKFRIYDVDRGTAEQIMRHEVGVKVPIEEQDNYYFGDVVDINPSNIVKKICSDLIDYGSVKRALLGVTMTPVTDEIAKEMKLSSVQGVYIREVLKGSAADEAGIREGDVLVAIDSMKVINASDVQAKVNNFYPGDKALMTVVRDGKEKTVEVTFKGTAAENGTVDEEGGVAFYGARLKEAPHDDLDRLGIKHGVEIVSVGPGKIMDAGVSDGFIILYVNDQPVSKPQDVLDIVKKQKRSVFIEGVTSYGKPSYFGFGI